jgi:hypothetical protein
MTCPNCAKKDEVNMKYRKKPVVIEAFQMTEERRFDNKDWPAWMNQAWNKTDFSEGSLSIDSDDPKRERLVIGTLEGVLRVNWGDFIIRGVKGEIYACKPDIFEQTYEVAGDGPDKKDEEIAALKEDRQAISVRCQQALLDADMLRRSEGKHQKDIEYQRLDKEQWIDVCRMAERERDALRVHVERMREKTEDFLGQVEGDWELDVSIKYLRSILDSIPTQSISAYREKVRAEAFEEAAKMILSSGAYCSDCYDGAEELAKALREKAQGETRVLVVESDDAIRANTLSRVIKKLQGEKAGGE